MLGRPRGALTTGSCLVRVLLRVGLVRSTYARSAFPSQSKIVFNEKVTCDWSLEKRKREGMPSEEACALVAVSGHQYE